MGYYYHVDHLGTPQALSNASGQIVWEAVYEPFGKATIPDPDGVGGVPKEVVRKFEDELEKDVEPRGWNWPGKCSSWDQRVEYLNSKMKTIFSLPVSVEIVEDNTKIKPN